MIFWDTSALIPLLVQEPASREMMALARKERGMVVWWGTHTECESALARRTRDGVLSRDDQDEVLGLLASLDEAWNVILPSDPVRRRAGLLLRRHPLRAADALQLAAALTWARGVPDGHRLVTLDSRLAGAARAEGFSLLP